MCDILVNYQSKDNKCKSEYVMVDILEYEKDEAITIINAILKQIPDVDVVYEYFIDDENYILTEL